VVRVLWRWPRGRPRRAPTASSWAGAARAVDRGLLGGVADARRATSDRRKSLVQVLAGARGVVRVSVTVDDREPHGASGGVLVPPFGLDPDSSHRAFPGRSLQCTQPEIPSPAKVRKGACKPHADAPGEPKPHSGDRPGCPRSNCHQIVQQTPACPVARCDGLMRLRERLATRGHLSALPGLEAAHPARLVGREHVADPVPVQGQ